MSGRTIGAGLGFLVGSFFGVPQLGMFIGSTLGGIVAPDTIEGNKVGNVPLQRSAPGAPQPVVLGTSLVDKCLVMSQGPDMIETETESVGKGSGQEVENEVLYRHFTVRVCRSSLAEDNQVAAIVAVYEYGKLVYDVRPNARISAADSAKWKANVTFYYGGPDQLTDPTEESYIGVGELSAHRQICRMVFNKKNLTEHGNAIPPYEVVVSRCGATMPRFLGTGTRAAGFLAVSRPMTHGGVWEGAADDVVSPTTDSTVVSMLRYGDYMAALVRPNSLAAQTRLTLVSDLSTYAAGAAPPTGTDANGRFTVSGTRLFNWSPGSPDFYYIDSPGAAAFTAAPALTGTGIKRPVAMAGNGEQVLIADTNGYLWGSSSNGTTFAKRAELNIDVVRDSMDCNGGRFVIAGEDKTLPEVVAYYTDDGGVTVAACTFPSGSPDRTPANVRHCGGGVWLMAMLNTAPGESGLYLSSDDGESFDPVTLPKNLYFVNDRLSIAVDAETGRVVIAGKEFGTEAPCYYYTDDFGAWLEIDRTDTECVGISAIYPAERAYAGDPIPDADGYYIDPTTGDISGPSLGEADMCGTTLAEVVTWLCQRGGLDADEIDVSELEGVPVRGITFQSAQSCKAELEPLRLAHFFDPSDFDSKLRFRLRGAADVDMVINVDHLIPTDDEDDETKIIGQDVEYPKRHHLEFLSLDLDYLRSTVTEERTSLDPTVVGEEQVSINEVFTTAEAKNIAAIQLKQAWMSKEGFWRGGLPIEYVQLVSASLVELESRRGRVDGMRTDLNEIWLDPVPFDRASTYSANTVAPEVTPPSAPGSGIRGPTDVVVMNMPVYRDNDDKPGLNWAARGYPNTGWRGARLQVQRGTQWLTLGEITRPCGVGTLLSDLPAHAGDVDEINTLHLRMPEDMDSGTFIDLLNERNPLAIIYPDGTVEVLQYMDANEISEGVWECTTLIRGRLDTVRGLHEAGARVVVLDNRPGFAQLRGDDVGKTLTLRAVSLGTDPDLAPTFTITLATMESQREWPPYNIQIVSDGAGGYCISWIGRARLGSDAFPQHSQFFDGYSVRLTLDGVFHDIETEDQSVCIDAAEMEDIFGPGYGEPAVAVVAKSTSSQQVFNGAAPAGWVALSGTWTEDPAGVYNLIPDGSTLGRMYYDTPYAFSSGTFEASVEWTGPILAGFAGMTIDFMDASGNSFLSENAAESISVTAASLAPFGTVAFARVYLRALSGSPISAPVTFSSLTVTVTP